MSLLASASDENLINAISRLHPIAQVVAIIGVVVTLLGIFYFFYKMSR